MTDLTARLRRLIEVAAQDPSWVGRGVTVFDSLITKAADRIEALEAENAALEFDVAALDALNITLEAECDLLRAAIKSDDVFRYTLVKPGQAVRPDGVVCDLMPDTWKYSFEETFDSTGKDGASHRYTSLRYTLLPVTE